MERSLRRFLHSPWFLPVSLASLVFLVLAPILWQGPAAILSAPGADIDLEFYFLRVFTAGELAKGHIPLWNPTLFSGNPCLGSWQSAVLYPPVWLHLLLSTATALNGEIALHVFLTGLFSAWLARRFGFHPIACLTCGVALMFGGAFYSHVYGGNLSLMEAMPWVPLVFLAADHLMEKPTLKWVLGGGGAGALMVLAGHPQTVYQAVITVTLYVLPALIAGRASRQQRVKALGGLAAAGMLGLALSAVQLLPSLQCAGEWSRAQPSYAQSATFSFPPESWLTLFVPGLFGNATTRFYWGRMYWWEVTPYLGVTMLPLIVIGYLHGPTPRRKLWLALMALCAVLMMGGFTPVFRVFYALMPGASRFRGYSKFEYEFCLFASLLGAAGLDALIKARSVPKSLPVLMGLMAAILAVAAHYFLNSTGENLVIWAHEAILNRGGEYYALPAQPAAFREMADSAAIQLIAAAGFFALSAGALAWVRRQRLAYLGLTGLLILEMASYASQNTVAFDGTQNRPAALVSWFATHPGDFRILQQVTPVNGAVMFHSADVWGYDPLRLRRYDELLSAAQGGGPAANMSNLQIARYFPTLALFRCAAVVQPSPEGLTIVPEPDALPHGVFVPHYEVVPSANAAGHAVLRPGFNARQTVILESDPGLAPVPVPPGAAGTIAVHIVNSDTLDVTATCNAPGLILITDPFSRFWRADALDDGGPYRVMPGNYAQIAIPVGPGRHHLSLGYRPSLFPVGRAISGLAVLLSLGLLVYQLKRADA